MKTASKAEVAAIAWALVILIEILQFGRIPFFARLIFAAIAFLLLLPITWPICYTARALRLMRLIGAKPCA